MDITSFNYISTKQTIHSICYIINVSAQTQLHMGVHTNNALVQPQRLLHELLHEHFISSLHPLPAGGSVVQYGSHPCVVLDHPHSEGHGSFISGTSI